LAANFKNSSFVIALVVFLKFNHYIKNDNLKCTHFEGLLLLDQLISNFAFYLISL
jgi:hypothetical protein